MRDSLQFPSARWPGGQAGAVLIMVLLIVALVAGLGIKFAGDYQLGLARAEARWHGVQARAYSYSAEGAAIRLIEKDDPSYDAADDSWAIEMPVEVDGGQLMLSLSDANSQFNLNSMSVVLANFATTDPLNAARYTSAQRMFIRLLQTLTVSAEDKTPLVPGPAEAAGILEAIVDWVDVDKAQSGANGAEDDYYLSQPDPYQAANLPFRSVEELQMIRGITPAIMRALRPHVMVLSNSGLMNINTMDDIFYRCINVSTELTPLDESRAKALRDTKPPSGHYATMGEFDTTIASVFGSGSTVDKDMLDVKTNFFWLKTIAVIGDQRRGGRSLIQRGNPAPTVVRREEFGSIYQ